MRAAAGRARYSLPLYLAALWLSIPLHAQQDTQAQQPAPYSAPQPPLPPARNAPGQQALPQAEQPSAPPETPLPRPNSSTVDLRELKPLSREVRDPVGVNASTQQVRKDHVSPQREAPATLFQTSPIRLVAPYRAARIPDLPAADPLHLSSLVRDGKLYLSLHDAVALAIENNLDVEVSRYNLLLADTDVLRSKGGGTLRGLDYTITQTSPGVGAQTSPLLNAATNGTTAAATPLVTDLSQITQAGSTAQQTLSSTNGQVYAPGPQIPLFDPVVTGQAGYLRRSDQKSLIETDSSASGTAAGTSTDVGSGPLSYVNTGVDYQQGFSFGAQVEAFVSNAPQVLYSQTSQYDPFHAPSTNVTFTQPLLRGRGRAVNMRFVRIARLNQQVSRLLFEQQLLETIYGISRLYYDLVSLGENIAVKEEALAAAERLGRDDESQVAEGTLAPIELTRVRALLAGSRLDLIQARGEYRQQEVILRQNLLRRLSDPASEFASIIPTDHIQVPANAPQLSVPDLTADALAKRPDLLQAGIQVQANEIAARGSANGVKPLLNLYANVQTRGSSLVPYQLLGSPGTGTAQIPAALTQGGLRLSTIYQGGIQLTLPLRNRIAQADAARDALQLRQSEGRAAKLENDVRQQVENASIALENAHQAYAAAVESRNYQQQLLQAEIDKFAVGASTNFQIVQDQAYLAQARSTEVAARSDYQKAQLALDRALGDLLEKNGIVFDEAVQGKLADHP